MKKFWINILVSVLVLSGCSQNLSQKELEISEPVIQEAELSEEELLRELEELGATQEYLIEDNPEFGSTAYSQQLADALTCELESSLDGQELKVENIKTTYVSKEYLEELEYNSQKNVFFGKTLDEVEAEFGDKPFIFTLGEDNTTVVEEFKEYNNTYKKALVTAGTGTGILLGVVAVSCATGNYDIAFWAVGGTVAGAMAGGLTAAISGYLNGDDAETIAQSAALYASRGMTIGLIAGTGVGLMVKTGMGQELITKAKLTSQELGKIAENRVRDALSSCNPSSQTIYMAGEEISSRLKGSTIPDFVYALEDGTLVATEVKNYQLATGICQMCTTLKNQLLNRVANMPEGTIMRVVLDVTDRGYRDDFLITAQAKVYKYLAKFIPNVEVEIFNGTTTAKLAC